MNRKDTIWQSSSVVDNYLEGVRAALPLATEQIEVMMRVIDLAGEPIIRFLDLGCGDGILGATILEKFPEAQGLFFDFSEPMISVAREKLGDENPNIVRPNNVRPNLEFVVGDYATSAWLEQVQHLAPYDAIVSGYSIHHQPDARKKTLYAEIFDLLKPGGLFINIEHVAAPTPWVERLWHVALVDGVYTQQQTTGGTMSWDELDQRFQESPENEANILALVEDQCAWLRDIGFVDVDCYFKVFGLSVFGGRRPRV